VTPQRRVAVLEADGSPVPGQFPCMQVGVFTPWGDLYLSVGTQEDSAAATRGGIHLFWRTADGSAFRLVESSVNISAPVGAPVFAYEYHPDSGEEPEGLDWWDRDHVPDSRYSGQLHVLLLNNRALRDDQLWLKHFRVNYSSDILWRSVNG